MRVTHRTRDAADLMQIYMPDYIVIGASINGRLGYCGSETADIGQDLSQVAIPKD